MLAASLRVEDVLDLKFCTEGVQTALHEESYEQVNVVLFSHIGIDPFVGS